MGAGFNGDRFVNDVAFHAGGGGQTHFQAAYTTHHATIDDHVISDDLALDRGSLADGQKMGADIALNSAFNLDIAGGLEIAGNRQIRR